MKRKLCSVLLALCMVLTLLPVSALAEGGATSDGDALKKLFSDVKAGEASSGNVTVTLDKNYNLTDYSWTSLTVDGYHGAGIVTVEGNNHTITGLNAPLFAGGFAGTSGIVIKNLTLTGVTINDSENSQGIGAFINNVDSMPKIELDNCHLTDSKITSTGGARVGGLIGWTSGYNKTDDGPVDTYITVKNCSVENTEITAKGSVGGIIGHAGCNPATFHTFNSNAVTNCTLNSTDNGGWRVGVVVGTANVGEISIANTTESNNTLTQTGKAFPDGQSNLYGRFVPNTTGKLVIDGVPVFNSDIIAAIGSTGYKTLADAVTAADNTTVTLLKDTAENVTIPAGKTITLDLNGHDITAASGCAIVNKGNLTVTGSGTVSTSADSSAAIANFPDATANVNGGTYISSVWYVIKNLGTMTIDGPVTVKKPDGSTDTSSVIANGWYGSKDKVAGEDVAAAANKANLTIKNGQFLSESGEASCSVVKNDDYGVLTINGGRFDSSKNNSETNAATIMNWNIATITDGTFIGCYPLSNGAYNNDADKGQLTVTGGKFIGTRSIFGICGGGDGKGAAIISGGTFDAPELKAIYDNVTGGYTVSITGGTYSINPDHVADTHIARKDSDTKFVVVEKANLTAGVYMSDPSSALAPGYVSYKNSDDTYTVYYPVPVTPGNTSSSTTKNPDGSTTTTTTDKTTGTVTETTKNPDGSTTTVETKKDGSVTETNKTANGSVGTVKSDANGNSEISANISAADVSAAAKKNEPVAAPVSVAPAASSAAAPVIKLSVPASAGEVSVVIPVTNAQQGTVAIKVNPDGTEEIIKTSVVTKDGVVLGVKGSAQIKIVNNDKDFFDTVGHWAESDVDFVSARELFTGTAPQTFSPESATTRGMVVTVLARLAGESTDGGANWYDKGCAWAVTNGVSDGTDPNGTVTREQLAAMLYRYFGSPAVSGSLSFADASSVSEYAHDAMQWCVNNGIINGMDGLLNPQGQATRAQVSAMFARYIRLAAAK